MRGVKPVMKKNGAEGKNEVDGKFPQNEFNWPGNRKNVVTPLTEAETRWYKSSKVGVVSFRVRKQM